MNPSQWKWLDDTVTCRRCGNPQHPGFPVALIGAWNGGNWYACAPCVRDVEGAAR